MSQNHSQSVPQQGEDKDNLLQNEQNEYNPLASPPELSKALKHKNARRVGKMDMTQSDAKNIEFCECCGLTTNHQPMPICGSRIDLADLGAGFPLYFEYVFFCGILMGLLFAIVGIYSLATNPKNLGCTDHIFDVDYPCKGGFIINYSLGNKGSKDDWRINGILNLVFVIVGLLASFYYRRVQAMTAEEVDRGSITTSDYTVMVSGIPTTETADKIKEFFVKKGKTGKGETTVVKVNLAYEIGTYVELVRKKANLEAKIAKGDASQSVKNELMLVESKLKVFEDAVDNNTSNKFTGIGFITFNTEKEAHEVIEKFQMGVFEKLIYGSLRYFLSCIGIKFERTYNGKPIDLHKAPDPLDVFWENLGYDWWKTMRVRLISFISTFILIAMSFGMILGISYWQENTKKNNANNTTLITFLAFLGSYIVVIINGLIGFFMRKLAGLEKHTTYTYYFISIANKLSYAQFINTALITLFVQLARGETIRLWVADSIVSKVFFLSLLNSFMPSLLYIFNPVYMLRLFKRSRMISQGDKSTLTQQQANSLFEGPAVDIAQRYANVQKTMLFTGFYANLVPIGIVFAFIGLFITYWTDKYMLLRRHSRPNVLGKQLAEEMSDFLELFFVAFTCGNLAFEKIGHDEISALNIVACAIAVVAYLLPQKFMAKCIRKNEQDVFNIRKYEEVRFGFVTEYDRVNPVTSDDAMKEWMMEISKTQGETSDGNKPAQNLSAYFQHMPKQNQFTNLTNYAQNNPSFRQMQQMNAPTNFNMNFVPRPQPFMIAQPVPMNQPGFIQPMQMMPQNRFAAFPNQMVRYANQQVNRFMPAGMPNPFGGFGAPRPAAISHFPQANPQQVAIQMPQAKPQVVSHFPQPQPQLQLQPQIQQAQIQQAPKPQVVNHFPQQQQQPPANQPPIANHFPQQQPPVNQPPVTNHFPQQQPPMNQQPFQMAQQPQPIMVKPQPQPQPQPQPFQMNMNPNMNQPMMQMGQPPMMQPQGMRPPAGIQMTQQVQPGPFGNQPQFGFQPPQQQFGGMRMAPPANNNTVFGGQPGFGFRNGF